jgi:hypothetical protein
VGALLKLSALTPRHFSHDFYSFESLQEDALPNGPEFAVSIKAFG